MNRAERRRQQRLPRKGKKSGALENMQAAFVTAIELHQAGRHAEAEQIDQQNLRAAPRREVVAARELIAGRGYQGSWMGSASVATTSWRSRIIRRLSRSRGRAGTLDDIRMPGLFVSCR
ncbi:MAG: hypothetical protein L0Z68_05235 [Gammaproteobacteria bacterium]|nr:hypothetical protein [Gammaproteobacteria bacterium]